MTKLILLLTLVCLIIHPRAEAAVSPVAVSVIPPVQFPPEDFNVTGLRASLLWGEHRDVFGLDFGALGNITNGVFAGAAVSGVLNLTRGQTTILGLQLAGGANINVQKANIYGLQAALGINSNVAQSKVVGIELAGIANLAMFTDVYGAQIGLYNHANEVYGLQIGVVNVASNLHGVQIGLANFNLKGLFYVSPILNIGF